MREIKFRGKRVDNGKWVYGYLSMHTIKHHEELTHYPYISFIDKDLGFYVGANVIHETVGQFTGFKDKNGVEIYEGDILESRASEVKSEWKRWICAYQDGSFCFESEIGKRKRKIEQNLLCADEIELYGLVVISNIHDNELMEVQTDEN